MRIYGRNSAGQWQTVQTDPATGLNDYVYITALAQALRLSPGESPFYSQYGIPSQQSVVTQVFPDYYVAKMQSLFAQYFASLVISRVPNTANANPSNPAYNVAIMTNQGVTVNQNIPT